MTVAAVLFQAVLWIWFLGCVTTYRFGKILLVEGMGIKSAEFIMLCLYSIGLLSCYCLRPAGKWILLMILALWATVQFFCHWFYTFFGASKEKLQGYNDSFGDSLRLFPMSETRLIPDLYHIILHLLILINIIFCVL